MSKTVIICEKPNAAQKIAVALGGKDLKVRSSSQGVKYYEFKKGNTTYVAIPAVGHIFGLKSKEKGWDYPVYDLEWVPTFEAHKDAEYVKKYYETFEEVGKGATDFIVATDLDEEGSVIGYNILRFIFNKKDAKRMRFSTLTKDDLQDAFKNLSKHLDFGRVESGLTRHYLDFLWGVNISRALTLSIKHFGKKLKYHLLSAGRVQTPMLYFLIKREKEIAAFKPKPFWELYAEVKTKPLIKAHHKKSKFWKKEEVDNAYSNAKSKKAIVKIIKKTKTKKEPPSPFDLTSLQTEAYKFFGYSPKRTSDIAQNLYTKGYISYPRTSSQKLPKQIGYKSILKGLAKLSRYKKDASELLSKDKLIPKEGKKSDPAHPAIYPTKEVPNLSELRSDEKKLYDLIVRRFLAVFGEPAVRESTKVVFDIGGEEFVATGSRTIESNWMKLYGEYAKFEEISFPDIAKGDEFSVKKIELVEKETQPPSRYSQGSIVKELEKRNLGTKATRAAILQTLYDRGYIEGKSIKVTKLGMVIGETLAKNVPDLTSERLTREFEKEMEKVYTGKVKMEKVVRDAVKVIKKISDEFKKNEKKIGQSIERAILTTQEEQSILGVCPKCKTGNLKILYSPKTKKKFVGCTNYPKCNNIYPLPSGAKIINTGKVCEYCHTPIIKVIRKGKRPFTMCLDPNCVTKKNWGKSKEKSKGKNS
jgi:DNA topoisomerase-1